MIGNNINNMICKSTMHILKPLKNLWKFTYILSILDSMRGKTKCPYCNKNVVVEVPDGAKGLQLTKCPNCGMDIKVDVSTGEKKEKEWESPIHPLVKYTPSSKPLIAGSLLIIVFILGIAMGTSIFFAEKAFKGEGFYQGEVYDEGENPIENVSVYLIDNTTKLVAKTDAKGYFSLTNISAGKHVIRLEKEGYKTVVAEIFVMPANLPALKDKFIMKKGEGEVKEKTAFAIIIKFFPYLAILFVMVSIPALIGGIFCFLKKYFVIAIVGAIFGIISIGFFIGSILSIVALVLILLSKDEFK